MDKPTKAKPSANASEGKLPPHLRARLEALIQDTLAEAATGRDLALWNVALRLIEVFDAEPTPAIPIPHGYGRPLAERLIAQTEAAIRFWDAEPYHVARFMVMRVAVSPFFFELPGAIDPVITSRCWGEPGYRDPAHDRACFAVEEAISSKLLDPDRRTPEKVVRATFRALGADEERVRSWFR